MVLALIPVIGPMLSVELVAGWEAVKFAGYIFLPSVFLPPGAPAVIYLLSLGVYALAF